MHARGIIAQTVRRLHVDCVSAASTDYVAKSSVDGVIDAAGASPVRPAGGVSGASIVP